jgi:hypothetical protein
MMTALSERGDDLAGKPGRRRCGFGAVGTHRWPADYEPIETELGKFAQPRHAGSRRSDHAETVDELGCQM